MLFGPGRPRKYCCTDVNGVTGVLSMRSYLGSVKRKADVGGILEIAVRMVRVVCSLPSSSIAHEEGSFSVWVCVGGVVADQPFELLTYFDPSGDIDGFQRVEGAWPRLSELIF